MIALEAAGQSLSKSSTANPVGDALSPTSDLEPLKVPQLYKSSRCFDFLNRGRLTRWEFHEKEPRQGKAHLLHGVQESKPVQENGDRIASEWSEYSLSEFRRVFAGRHLITGFFFSMKLISPSAGKFLRADALERKGSAENPAKVRG